MIKQEKDKFIENEYDIPNEAKNSTLFGIGNGYFGIRGSFEEFGDVSVQGLYIRGVFDQIVEIPNAFADNLYMKNYYFDQMGLKRFEKEDSCINICDPLTIRFFVDEELFLPWKGKIISWARYIDYKTGGLVREVTWDDGKGNITKFIFERYASFKNNHLILQQARVEKINHSLPVEVKVGVDTLVKTNGQHKSTLKSVRNEENHLKMSFYMGDKYNHEVYLSSRCNITGAGFIKNGEEDQFFYSSYLINETSAIIQKVTAMYSNVDKYEKPIDLAENDSRISYEEALREHLEEYSRDFEMADIKIHNNDEYDAMLRYANYQTLISFDRHENVHSLAAKNLTAEKYNQFVWWDAEIFNLPFLISCFPKAARSCLEYRYRSLPEARKSAKKDGYKGAKFAFCSSVNGNENVWIYARHPFLQIHINGDVAYGILNYYQNTLDKQFMKDMGLEMLLEVLRYFASRTTLKDDGLYYLLNVTGTDEHHPYVNDDAYTNYETNYIAKEFLRLTKEFDYSLNDEDLKDIDVLANKLYLPLPNEKGLIPQFEDYFSLNPSLELVGSGAGTSFQMKQSGLYHLSQIIKQPDVLNLYTYLDIGMRKDIYKQNFDFYYDKCESSSSLSYPTHALGALYAKRYDLFIDLLKKTLLVDIDDIFKGAYQGVHAGCIAGGHYSVLHGIFGIRGKEDYLEVNPIFDSPINDLEMNFTYHGHKIHIQMKDGVMTLKTNESINLDVLVYGKKMQLTNGCLFINTALKEVQI